MWLFLFPFCIIILKGMSRMEYHFFKRVSFIFLMLFTTLSLIYFIAPAKYSLPFTYYIMCGVILGIAIFKFTMLNIRVDSKQDYILNLTEALINVFVGVIAINFGQEYILLSVFLGIVYLIVPIIRIFLAKIKINQIFIDSFKFLAGFVLIASNANYIWWIKFIIGGVFFMVALSIFITKIIHLHQSRKDGIFYE